MPNNKSILLQSKINNTLFNLMPKTDSSIVAHTKTINNQEVVTTVAAELEALADEIAALPTYVDTLIGAIENAAEVGN